jgi:hypothetical protein
MSKLSLRFSMLILSFCLHAQMHKNRIVSPDVQSDNSVIFRMNN